MSDVTLDVLGDVPDNSKQDSKVETTPPVKKRGRRKTTSREENSRDRSLEQRSASGFIRRWTREDAEREDWGEVPDPELMPNIEMPGFKLYYIRTELDGRPDTRRIAEATNLGWEPVLVSDLPPGINAPNFRMDGIGQVVGISGMVLCRMPEKLYEKISAKYKQAAKAQVAGVGKDLENVVTVGGNAQLQRSVKSTIERGRTPVQGD